MNVDISPIRPGNAVYEVRVYRDGEGKREVGGDPYADAFLIVVGKDMIPEVRLVTRKIHKDVAHAIKQWAIERGYVVWRRTWPDGRSVVRPLVDAAQRPGAVDPDVAGG